MLFSRNMRKRGQQSKTHCPTRGPETGPQGFTRNQGPISGLGVVSIGSLSEPHARSDAQARSLGKPAMSGGKSGARDEESPSSVHVGWWFILGPHRLFAGFPLLANQVDTEGGLFSGFVRTLRMVPGELKTARPSSEASCLAETHWRSDFC